MTTGVPVPYEVMLLAAAREQFQRWTVEAPTRGVQTEYVAALEFMMTRLQNDPQVWGDPLYHLHHLDLRVHRGFAHLFYVRYGVDPVRRLVYVMGAFPAPGQGLDTAGTT